MTEGIVESIKCNQRDPNYENMLEHFEKVEYQSIEVEKSLKDAQNLAAKVILDEMLENMNKNEEANEILLAMCKLYKKVSNIGDSYIKKESKLMCEIYEAIYLDKTNITEMQDKMNTVKKVDSLIDEVSEYLRKFPGMIMLEKVWTDKAKQLEKTWSETI